MPSRDSSSAINSYVTDMLSLESHIEKALRSQLQDLKDYPDFSTAIKELHRKVEHHVADLKELSDRRDASGTVEAIKRAGAAVAGMAAGMIDLIRTEGLPKNLRDDYTAFNLASIGYLMLHTTALSLGEQEVATLARQHYVDYANAIMRLNSTVPTSVIRYLQSEGLPAREEVLGEVRRMAESAWRSQAAEAGVEEGATAASLRSGPGRQ